MEPPDDRGDINLNGIGGPQVKYIVILFQIVNRFFQLL
jgi:hypothetical protein